MKTFWTIVIAAMFIISGIVTVNNIKNGKFREKNINLSGTEYRCQPK